MVKYQISVASEETEKVDTMRFAWQKLNTLAVRLLVIMIILATMACVLL